ncbi:DUF4349 domain-containing protein [Nonomuraea sp. NBC_01738]|uniref:DUF4349 domain-containing protein n=1 Tax=Nonomuraea sp. NBC_01738 TaxID=2976003 RepID=UPI002E0F23D7|nr:DUF4349 domain-containing protein [Nonomuraea sp. NBC_01738]
MKRLALAAAVAVLTVSACGGGGSAVTDVFQDSGGAVASQAAAAPEAAYDGADQSAPTKRKTAPNGQSETITGDIKVTQEDRQIIYVSTMTVRAKDVPAAVDKAKLIVTGAGGYLAKEESSSAESDRARAALEFKIPPANYQNVLAAMGKDLGTKLSQTQGTQDVTLEVADVDSRLKSAEGALASLRTLLGKTKTIGQVLQVEREIANREAELESLQAQQKELARQVAMATLTLQIVAPDIVVEEPEDEPAGFLGGLTSGWRALVSFLKVAVTVVGAVLPWLLVLVPVVWVIVVLVRRSRRRRPPRQEGPAVPARPEPEEPEPDPEPEEAATPSEPVR